MDQLRDEVASLRAALKLSRSRRTRLHLRAGHCCFAPATPSGHVVRMANSLGVAASVALLVYPKASFASLIVDAAKVCSLDLKSLSDSDALLYGKC